MDARVIARQVVDFSKFVFDSSFSSMCLLQDMTGRAATIYMQQVPGIPEETKKVFDDWMNAFKSGREQFKSTLDESFKKTGECLYPSQ